MAPRHTEGTTQRGSATLEGAILFPALLALIFTVIQAALYFHARHLALAAAQEGVRAARAQHASTAAGLAAARSFLDTAADDTFTRATVTAAGSTPTRVRIQVRGRVLSVLPATPDLEVTQHASGPVERFTTPERP